MSDLFFSHERGGVNGFLVVNVFGVDTSTMAV
jgi:hypothetical protein